MNIEHQLISHIRDRLGAIYRYNTLDGYLPFGDYSVHKYMALFFGIDGIRPHKATAPGR